MRKNNILSLLGVSIETWLLIVCVSQLIQPERELAWILL
jgi:hypothetical protein